MASCVPTWSLVRVCDAGMKGRKRKKPGRLAPSLLEDYVELDDGTETETPVGSSRRLGGPGRRPSGGLRPTSGLTERQCAHCLCACSPAWHHRGMLCR